VDLETERAIGRDHNGGVLGVGVAGDVGQCLGADPVGRDLDRRRKYGQRRRCLEDD
jgi:hypothetical protein